MNEWRGKFKFHPGPTAIARDCKILKEYYSYKKSIDDCVREWNTNYEIELSKEDFICMANSLGYRRD